MEYEGAREEAETRQIWNMFSGRSTDPTNGLNGGYRNKDESGIEIKMNLSIFGLNTYLDRKLALRWGKLGRKASL